MLPLLEKQLSPSLTGFSKSYRKSIYKCVWITAAFFALEWDKSLHWNTQHISNLVKIVILIAIASFAIIIIYLIGNCNIRLWSNVEHTSFIAPRVQRVWIVRLSVKVEIKVTLKFFVRVSELLPQEYWKVAKPFSTLLWLASNKAMIWTICWLCCHGMNIVS